MTLSGALAIPAAYRAFGVLVGAARAQEIFVREYLRPGPGARVLDIGCGTGELASRLSDVQYVGFDASAAYVEAARRRFAAARFSCATIEEYAAERDHFDIAVACGVLHHLNDGQVLALARLAHASLRPGGRLVTLDGCYLEDQSQMARWLLTRDRGRHVRSADEYLRLVGRVFSRVEPTVRHDLLRMPYTHLVIQCTRE